MEGGDYIDGQADVPTNIIGCTKHLADIYVQPLGIAVYAIMNPVLIQENIHLYTDNSNKIFICPSSKTKP